jgi:phosphatidylglycerol:prolipoprotein diacylglycerol transferase
VSRHPEGTVHQVLFHIPIAGYEIPIYGFGMMLFVAFLLCTWLAGRRAQKAGIAPEHIQDLAIWLFLGGILGARLTFLVVNGRPLWEFYRIWDGGLVLYGSVAGGLVGYVLGYYFILRKHGISTWKVADVLAPSIALGIGLGRIGCLLNGCCYGDVACPQCLSVTYPLSAPPRYELVQKGVQTAAGFLLEPDRAVVKVVEEHSPAAQHGLRGGDEIRSVNGHKVEDARDVAGYLSPHGWPLGERTLTLEVVHAGTEELVELNFSPRTVGLHPTQIYETISMFLLLGLLLAYEPFRRHDGELMALLMFCYGLHRFVNEKLRSDDRPIELERNVSLLLIATGLGLGFWLWRRPGVAHPQATDERAAETPFTAPATSARTPASQAITRRGR